MTTEKATNGLTFQFIRQPNLGETVPPDLSGLAALMRQPQLAEPACALARAISHFESHMQRVQQVPTWSFFRDLLPAVCSWACQAPWATKQLPLLTSGDEASARLPRPWVRCLISNAFLLNISCPSSTDLPLPPASKALLPKRGDAFGKHDWKRVFSTKDCALSTHKVLCMLAYLQHTASRLQSRAAMKDPPAEPDVIVERVQVTSPSLAPVSTGGAKPGSWAHWSSSTAPVTSSMVKLHTGSMESSPARAFVDFANRYVGYRAIIPSMTQEEILWVCVPEAQPAALMCEAMSDDEVVLVRNVERVSAYSGYLDSFRWKGFWTGAQTGGGDAAAAQTCAAAGGGGSEAAQDLLVMDAHVVHSTNAQFRPQMMARDLSKAWMCFAAYGRKAPAATPGGRSSFPDVRAVSSGNWGCGAFGGHRVLKFLQQLCALAEANASLPPGAQLRLDFSTFGDDGLTRQLQQLLVAVERGGGGERVTVGRLCGLVAEFGAGEGTRIDKAKDEEVLLQWLVASLAGGRPGDPGQGQAGKGLVGWVSDWMRGEK